MALSADKMRPSRSSHASQSYKITNAQQIYAGAIVGLDMATGYLAKWADTATFRFLGIAKNKKLGDTSASPVVEVDVDVSGMTLQKVAVTGVSAITHVGDLVYASDDDVLTLTPGANAGAIGFITRWYSSTTSDVQLFTPAEHRALIGS